MAIDKGNTYEMYYYGLMLEKVDEIKLKLNK